MKSAMIGKPGDNKKNKQVLIISTTEGRGFGAEVILEELLRGWPNPTEYFVIVGPKDSRAVSVGNEHGIETIGLPMNDNIVSIQTALFRYNDKIPRCNIVHGWSSRAIDAAYVLSKTKHSKFSVTMHDHPNPEYSRKRRHMLVGFLGKRAHKVICVSNAVESACRENGFGNRTIVVRNGIADQKFNTSMAHTPICIGFLGMRSDNRGFSIIEKWIHSMKIENVEWHFYGEVCQELKKKTENLVIQYPGKIVVHGNQNRTTIFSTIDILIHASMMFDSLPTVLIEAAMAGIPAIGSDFGGAKEIIKNGITGYLFNPEYPDSGMQNLRDIVNNENKRKEMGIAARKCFESDFTISTMVLKYKNVWDFLAS
jgi:glycosyltransferase involved in cell wall biosynthesis